MLTVKNFKNSCAGCGKTILSYAVDRSGTLPVAFCDSICETQARMKKKFQVKTTTSYHAKGW